MHGAVGLADDERERRCPWFQGPPDHGDRPVVGALDLERDGSPSRRRPRATATRRSAGSGPGWCRPAGGSDGPAVVATLCQTATPATTTTAAAIAPTAPRSRRARTRRETSAYGGMTTRSRTSPARSGRSRSSDMVVLLGRFEQLGEGGAAPREARLDGALGHAQGVARPRRRAGRRGGAARWPRAGRRAAGAARPSGRGGPRAGRRTPRTGPGRGPGGVQRSIRRHRLRATLTATVRSQASGLSASWNELRPGAARANASITASSASAGSPVTPTSWPTRRGYATAYTSRSRPPADDPSMRSPPAGSLNYATSGRRTGLHPSPDRMRTR